eukprot:g4927.t1
MYVHTPPTSFTISVLNDDDADVKLQIPQDDGSFEYRLKVMGPMTIDEGASTKYALVLETQPSANVSVFATIVMPRPNTPLTVRLVPPSLVFTMSNWNVPQVVTVAASNDNIDNDQDAETIRVVYHAITEDSIFQSKATNNTVIVQIADDDTAGVAILEDTNVIELTEGGDAKEFVIKGLTSEPLQQVYIVIQTTNPSLIEITPPAFTILPSLWQTVNQKITVRALNGKYAIGTTFDLTVQTNSSDPKNKAEILPAKFATGVETVVALQH